MEIPTHFVVYLVISIFVASSSRATFHSDESSEEKVKAGSGGAIVEVNLGPLGTIKAGGGGGGGGGGGEGGGAVAGGGGGFGGFSLGDFLNIGGFGSGGGQGFKGFSFKTPESGGSGGGVLSLGGGGAGNGGGGLVLGGGGGGGGSGGGGLVIGGGGGGGSGGGGLVIGGGGGGAAVADGFNPGGFLTIGGFGSGGGGIVKSGIQKRKSVLVTERIDVNVTEAETNKSAVDSKVTGGGSGLIIGGAGGGAGAGSGFGGFSLGNFLKFGGFGGGGGSFIKGKAVDAVDRRKRAIEVAQDRQDTAAATPTSTVRSNSGGIPPISISGTGVLGGGGGGGGANGGDLFGGGSPEAIAEIISELGFGSNLAPEVTLDPLAYELRPIYTKDGESVSQLNTRFEILKKRILNSSGQTST